MRTALVDTLDPPIRVLFVCSGNSARSQIAEALLEQIGGPTFEVDSAGTGPKGVNPCTIRILAEAGIDWSEARSKSVMELVDPSYDYVITVCDRARQACPIFPGVYASFHWSLPDPSEVEESEEARLFAFRRTYLDLAQRIRPFVEAVLATRDAARVED